MRTKLKSRNPKSRRRDTNRRNFLKVECLEHRMVLTGIAPIAANDLYDAVMDEPLGHHDAGHFVQRHRRRRRLANGQPVQRPG